MEKKNSTVEDDFESLFEEEAISTKKENKNLSFNDLFEAIAEESADLVEHRESLDVVDNVEEDFEALLSDENETEVGNSDQSIKEVPSDLVKGFSQIFASENSPKVFDNHEDSQHVLGHNDPDHGDPGNQLDLTQGDNVERDGEMQTVIVEKTSRETELEEQLKVITKEMMTEKLSFESKLKQHDAEISNLKDEIKNLRNNLSKIETQKNAAEHKIAELEKQKIASESLSKVNSSEKYDGELLFQIKASNDKIKLQETLIDQLKKEMSELKTANKQTANEDIIESRPDDPSQKIILLEHELEDQKEVSEKLKAYVGEVLENVMISNPAVLERKQSRENL